MAGLLDYIFVNLDSKTLTRQEVQEHLVYLNEIITPDMSVSEQVKYLSYKIKLGRKLNELDKANFYNTVYRAPIVMHHHKPLRNTAYPVF